MDSGCRCTGRPIGRWVARTAMHGRLSCGHSCGRGTARWVIEIAKYYIHLLRWRWKMLLYKQRFDGRPSCRWLTLSQFVEYRKSQFCQMKRRGVSPAQWSACMPSAMERKAMPRLLLTGLSMRISDNWIRINLNEDIFRLTRIWKILEVPCPNPMLWRWLKAARNNY